MHERRYHPELVEESFHPVFRQLEESFPHCEVWVEFKNLSRWYSAVLLDRSTGASASVHLVEQCYRRTWSLSDFELRKIRNALREQSEVQSQDQPA